MSRLMTITIVVRATGDQDNPIDISCSVDDESGLSPESAMTLAVEAIAKVARDNQPEDVR
jgi:hypothetical protein